MARNKVQFQKGLSEAAFEALYGTEEKCRAVVIASRWPNGFDRVYASLQLALMVALGDGGRQ